MSAGVRWECMRLAAVEVKTSDLVRLRVVGIVPYCILFCQVCAERTAYCAAAFGMVLDRQLFFSYFRLRALLELLSSPITWFTSLPLEKSCRTQIPELFAHVEAHQPPDHLRPLGHVVDLVASINVQAPAPLLIPPPPPPPPGQHPPTTAAPAVVH